MPMESYARRVAVQLTGRQRWSASRGPAPYAGREPMQLLGDLIFTGQPLLHQPFIAIENRPFKLAVGLEAERRFFTPVELATSTGLNDLLAAFDEARQRDPQAKPTDDQRRALDVRDAVDTVAMFAQGRPLAIVPSGGGRTFLRVGTGLADPGAETVQAAFAALGEAYRAGGPVTAEVERLRSAIDALGQLGPGEARGVRLEVFYDRHNPWLKTAIFYALSIVLFGASRLFLRRPITILACLVAGAGVVEHVLAVGLRVAILDRAPVTNTFESLLWMGLIGIGIGVVAQVVNRRAWYLVAGLGAALVSVLFAGLVPLEDRTNSIPAVLRSNFWLTIHVLTIVASYGALAVAAVLGHVYLAKEVLFARGGQRAAADPRRSAPLIVQTYRTIQIGLVLLTAGTILGGVWAAESWGRFWGWDPKETWALISILTYFAVLHARYVRWLQDFGLAVSAVLGFVVIVWTFYGVNYVMATGLHSYGFGSGGERWVAIWAIGELVFLIACRVRFVARRRRRAPDAAPSAAIGGGSPTGALP